MIPKKKDQFLTKIPNLETKFVWRKLTTRNTQLLLSQEELAIGRFS